MKAKSGFTLVEILIVVVILGILAAIVIPQFTSASTEAKESALVSDLQAMRSQIELYKIHHNDNLPGEDSSGNFLTAMTTNTDQDGVAGGRFGPYMRNIPNNPFSTAAAGENSVATGIAIKSPTAVGDNASAWWFVTEGADAGTFQANDDKTNVLEDPPVPHTAY